jgi:DNA repair protein RecO (recombination protein O)
VKESPVTFAGTARKKMAILKSKAIPIRISDYSETSVIAVFFTRDYGAVRVIYKGARRKAKAYKGTVDLLVPGELTFYGRTSGLNILKEFAPREDFPGLHRDLERYRAAMACLEFVRAVAVESEPAAGLFDVFSEALVACARGKHPWSSVYAFLMAGLSETGFAPALDVCASCGGKEFPRGRRARTAFSFEEGGALCMKCGKLCQSRPAAAASGELSPILAREVSAFLKRYSEFTFEQRFRMLK